MLAASSVATARMPEQAQSTARVDPVRASIRVWVASVSEHAELLESTRAQLSASSQARLQRIAPDHRQAEFLLARCLLAHAVQRWTGHPLGIAQIDDAGPCPRLPDALGLQGSVSHSQGEVAVGLAAAPLGIDMEVFDYERELLPVAERVFQPAELAWIKNARNPKALRQRFHRLWTGREAAYKAGLLHPVTAPPSWVGGGEWQPPWPVQCRLTATFALSGVTATAAELSVVRARLRDLALSAAEAPEQDL